MGIGAVLSQIQDGKETPLEYFSKVLHKPERNYCVTRRELLAMVKSISHFHHYLYGRHFLLRTDHAALRWLLNFKNPEGQIARWIQHLQEYDLEIQHRPGRLHGNADALSRRPCEPSCYHCERHEVKDDGTQNVRRTRLQDPDLGGGSSIWSDERIRDDQKMTLFCNQYWSGRRRIADPSGRRYPV